MGDELGLLNDQDWAEVPEHADDSRWAHRQVMPWPTPPDTHGVHASVRSLIAVRQRLPHLHAAVPTEVLDPRDPGVLLLLRRHPLGPMLGVYNVTDSPRQLPASVLHEVGLTPADVVDRLTGERPSWLGETLDLPPYAALWLT